MPITPQPFALNALKDMTQVDKIHSTADFDTYILEWTISISFLTLEKYAITC